MGRSYHNSFFAMNTRCFVLLPGMGDSEADRLFQSIKTEVLRIENKISRFLPTSDLSFINKKAAEHPVYLDDEMFDIIKTCIQYFKQTDGRFDVTLRPLMNYWSHDNSPNPNLNKLEELRSSLGTDAIHIDDADRTVSFEHPEVEIDLGGFGKGYALTRVDDILTHHEVEHLFLSFGESSILTRGSHPAGPHWKIGLKDYRDSSRTMYNFSVNHASISTSSNFYVNDNGRLINHRHVIHPFTAYPIEACLTASVCSASAIEAEVLSTAYLIDAADDNHIKPPPRSDITIVTINYDSNSVEPEITTSKSPAT